MSSTSQKYLDIVSAPMDDKLVTELPGIQRSSGLKLRAAGYHKAREMVGKFLSLGRDKKLFEEWLKDTCNGSIRVEQCEDCYQCLSDWCEEWQ